MFNKDFYFLFFMLNSMINLTHGAVKIRHTHNMIHLGIATKY